ncbi:MAG: LicD family protein [Candidatus Cloacimonadales bacterium]
MAGKAKLVGKNLAIAEKMLADITGILEKLKITYWLEGGTLLGIIREERLLPWDNDMDISIKEAKGKKLFWNSFRFFLKGYRVSYKYFRKDIAPFHKGELRMIKIRDYKFFPMKGEVLLDIFIKKAVDQSYYWVVGDKNMVLKSSPASLLAEFTTVDFRGKAYSVPQQYKEYLTHRYKDWQTPVKEWNFKKDDNAIVENFRKEK